MSRHDWRSLQPGVAMLRLTQPVFIVAFVCKVCGSSIGDPLYRQVGHSPEGVCLDCYYETVHLQNNPYRYPTHPRKCGCGGSVAGEVARTFFGTRRK